MYARRMRWMAHLLVVVTVWSSLGELGFVEAQGASSTTVARRLFREGIREARRRNWQEAHDAFARSYELSPRSTTLLNLAGTQRQLGRWVAAAESYRRFLSSNDERGRRARQQNRVAEQALEERHPDLYEAVQTGTAGTDASYTPRDSQRPFDTPY